jgi:hypothetical protein
MAKSVRTKNLLAGDKGFQDGCPWNCRQLIVHQVGVENNKVGNFSWLKATPSIFAESGLCSPYSHGAEGLFSDKGVLGLKSSVGFAFQVFTGNTSVETVSGLILSIGKSLPLAIQPF